jgi:DNA polymerase III epsilon subunit family exonuclease
VPFRPTTQQKKAIEAPMGPVLVVAGPGAGKTACLIGRIAHLVANGLVPAERICAVTFTNKAAEEIAVRLTEALGHRGDDVRRGTIHALCADILRAHADDAGLKPGFGIADEDYQATILRQMGQGKRARALLGAFGRHKLQGRELQPGDAELLREYERRLGRRNMVDFDDLVVRTRRLFDGRPSVAEAVAGRWSYLLVDEFQDVNAAQYAILLHLARPHGNLFAVGDDEQSIFSWAGADPQILARFRADHGIAAPILLDRNHRTTQQIFSVARRLVEGNPSLFEKELTATRLSPFEVTAYGFADEEAEASWILDDLAADLATHNRDHPDDPLGWGDCAVLYRRHEVGDRLESRFVKAGIPCRLAKGRPLADDRVIGHVIAALRLVRDPADAAAAEQFARGVLPPHLMERVQAEVDGETPFLLAVRDLAAAMRRDPESRKLWRLVFAVENLAALGAKHRRLPALVDELLVGGVGTFKNALEDRHEELTDPLAVPGAAALAERLRAAQRTRSRVVLEPMGGLEIPLRGMLAGAGFRLAAYAAEVEQAELDDVRIGPADAGPDGLALTVFKALQVVQTAGLEGAMERYVTFDLETTDLDITACDIVEIAAVRVEQGVETGRFASLVRPERPIHPRAQATHGIGPAEVALAPPFAEVWPRFRDFVGDLPLVAHNAQHFDVPVLRRLAAPLGGAERYRVFDTLPLARALSGDSATLGSLAQRFGIDTGHAHRALDDALTLVGVYEALEERRVVRSRRTALVNVLPHLGVAFALDPRRRDTDEVAILMGKARIQALGRFSDALEVYGAERRRTGISCPPLEQVVETLGGRRLMDTLRAEPDPSRKYPAAVARLAALIEQDPDEPLDAAIGRFLERVALSTSRGADVDPHRVNLLTLHSTKGLEFSRVYVVGVEDEQLPGWVAPGENVEQVVQEARRLLYVGMTRARERLVLTRVDRRAGRPAGGSSFLEEMGLAATRP